MNDDIKKEINDLDGKSKIIYFSFLLIIVTYKKGERRVKRYRFWRIRIHHRAAAEAKAEQNREAQNQIKRN